MNLAKLAQKARTVVDKNGDKIAAGVGKATDFVDKKTKGKHHDRLEKIDGLAAKLDKTRDDTDDAPKAAAPPAAPPPAPPAAPPAAPPVEADRGPAGDAPADT